VNITHLVENLNRGGLERVVIDLVREQVAEGHRVDVICLFEEGQLAPELDVPIYAARKGGGFDIGAIRRVRARLKERGSAVLHTHNAMAHYYGMIAAIGLPIACRINTRHNMTGLGGGSRRDWLYRRSLMLTDAVVSVSEAAHADLVASRLMREGRAIAVPNGIPIRSFLPVSRDAHARLAAEIGVAQETRIVGAVGRLHPAKDHANLLRAFRLVADAVSDVVLVIVGGGALREALEALAVEQGIDDRVRFLGDRGDVRELLRGFDLLAVASRTEGYSVVLVEASAVGLPIVATGVGGNAEIVRDGVSGLIVPPSDPAALAAGLRALLDDRTRAERMGEAGRAWALGEGSVETMAKRYEAIYRGAGAS
jgi:glycosyltransferase involved in cell wall biosynthesis